MVVRWFDLADELLVCACDALRAAGQECPPRTCVVVGEVAHEDGCDGQLWVRMLRAYRSDDFPTPNLETGRCASAYAIELEIGMIRCYPVGDDAAPTCDELEGAAAQLYGEAEIVRTAIACCLDAMEGDMTRNVSTFMGELTYTGPNGAVAGWTLSTLLGLPDCRCT